MMSILVPILSKIPNLRVSYDLRLIKLFRDEGLFDGLESWTKSRYSYGQRTVPMSLISKLKPSLIERVFLEKPYFNSHVGIKVKLPTNITPELAYVLGYTLGDGTLTTTDKRDFCITLSDSSIEMLQIQKKLIKELFDYDAKIKRGHRCWSLIMQSVIIFNLFNFLGIPRGKKKTVEIPRLIKDSEFVLDFIAGFFDAEGSVRPPQFAIAQKSKYILEEIRTILSKIGIEMKIYPGTRCYILYGNKKASRIFFENVRIRHPTKIARFKEYLEARGSKKS